jgi:hypothetical protein
MIIIIKEKIEMRSNWTDVQLKINDENARSWSKYQFYDKPYRVRARCTNSPCLPRILIANDLHKSNITTNQGTLDLFCYVIAKLIPAARDYVMNCRVFLVKLNSHDLRNSQHLREFTLFT